ncbi:glycerol-3-phosphate dehydrogenase [Acidiphilium iwatense]|uniref:Glycerol-3-phosphate dehydrogenase n=1 Tax=Acidiphilium iwatense TaxID=768198 RepID=A0ABS9DYU2_9PROT|nr:glycerol-3-phosphate dehydrogenase [Acidiphilium iwatense]MCF3947863.1 glycerol-3-phosphate dehydrogenase [Acidiphilium iwatense]
MSADLLIVGGGINGTGIARDAAGRGLSVLLVEQDDLASHTSSASTKLIHGGLRYLEYYEFRLVREALMERERLLGIAPHIIWPLEFVLPHSADQRPAWMIRIGLFLYDHLAKRERLAASRAVGFPPHPAATILQPAYRRGFTYSDCWVEDSRLVVLNAMDAAERGADIRTRTQLVSARPEGTFWRAEIEDRATFARETVMARALVNAAGPWVGEVLSEKLGRNTHKTVRMVKGSHIIVRKRYEGDFAFILQNPDKRIVFAVPYEHDFTLIGTTDIPYEDDPSQVVISADETRYLCDSVSRYFRAPVTPADVVRSYSGVRPLYDDHAKNASAVTRDYVLDVEGGDDKPALLSVFGGKITTYRRLSEHALEKLLPAMGRAIGTPWTAGSPLPGGDMENADFSTYLHQLTSRYSFLPPRLAHRLARAYGTRAERILGDAASLADLGTDLGGGLTEAEVNYLVAHEWARETDDILWRRSKLVLHVPDGTQARLAAYLASLRTAGPVEGGGRTHC